ncbi:hypothetical protein AV540_16490 [Brevibacillus parabrevis]|uniref:ABC transporter substrate-binding protein n=1 Tax=Brevibacillus parabrevis TaxID=54914 RepID=UPI0007AB5456|nr:hypothetical protein AV540_16490 [Brevibacillus parabrevis]
MITYQSENGPVEVPAQPKRIVGLTNAPNVVALGGTLVGIDEWTKKNPLFTDKVKDVEVVSDETMEKILALQPDLIIAGSWMKNLDKMKEIAPTVVYTWGKLDYLAQQREIGKGTTVSVFEHDTKDFYVFGNNWARGTEILYKAMAFFGGNMLRRKARKIPPAKRSNVFWQKKNPMCLYANERRHVGFF